MTIEGEEALEWLKRNEQSISDYYDANKDKVNELHKAMIKLGVEAHGANNIDMLLHAAFVLDNLNKTEGKGRIEYAKSIGLLALRGNIPLIAATAIETPETTH